MRLAPNRTSVRQARKYVRAELEAHRIETETVDTVELLTSELVTNAVVHAGTPCELAVSVEPHRVRVEVVDGSQEIPVRRPPDPSAPAGRGMVILEALARAWGADPVPDGKRVWFEIGL